MTHKEIDFGIVGNANKLCEFLEKYEKGEKYDKIKGLAYRKGKKTIIEKFICALLEISIS